MNPRLSPRYAVVFISLALATSLPMRAADAPLSPFGSDVKVPPATELKMIEAKPVTIDCFGQANAGAWSAENPPDGAGTNLFSLGAKDGKDALSMEVGDFTPARTTVRILLPGEGPANGDVWAKARANYVSFFCKSNQPADMTFHLLVRGKTSGTYSAPFSVGPGGWQQVIVPLQDFGLKSFGKVAGLGFRMAEAEKGTQVEVADVTVSSMPFTDDTWKNRKLSISLKGAWHFSPDPENKGMTEKWFEPAFNDAGWKTLQSGTSWQEQGEDAHGWGWYRQNIVVPQEMAGVPLRITLCKIASDDDAWFNGTRIGGWSGEYKYDNQIVRSYVVPPSLIHYGQPNSIAVRVWGGNLGFIGNKSGLVAGPLSADLDPYGTGMRDPGGAEVPADNYDLSDAQRGKPFQIVLHFPPELAKEKGTVLSYRLADAEGAEIKSGKVPLEAGQDQTAQAVIPIDAATAKTIYLRGRLKIGCIVDSASGAPVYSGTRLLDRLSFDKRDATGLPALPETMEETPYGKLKLVDEIDCTTDVGAADAHPYLQSGMSHAQDRMTPGSEADIKVVDILGKKAREIEQGWFAYRVGRGKIKAHSTYLLRVEYPEDKARYCPMEIQVGQTFLDVGWKNGVSPDDVYDNWPLSHAWQWYDVIVPTDVKTTGAGGAGSSPIENGFWVYFMNHVIPGKYFLMYDGGPAIAKIKLYEINPETDAPVIHKPQGLPNRVLSFDWERQPDHEPADLAAYAKLMGYSAISPIILKWGLANYAEPLNGYNSINPDSHAYWAWENYDPAAGQPAKVAVPGKDSTHVRYLAATKHFGIDYIPRIEYGGSLDLPQSAWAKAVDGTPMKPDRFGTWGANLIDPATWDDIKKLMDADIKPYVKDNPQMTGVLWRIRQDRMPISYGRADVELFSKETNTPLPPGGDAQIAAWAAGDMKTKYDDWWHKKREQFHAKLVDLLHSYSPNLTLYYYNWDGDKFCLISPDLNSWGFLMKAVKPGPDGGRAAYESDRKLRKSYTAADYISVMHTGNFGEASKGINRADYGIRPELYADVKGMQIFAPVNYLCYALPDYINYFQMPDGLAVSNAVPYDELGSRSINPKYEGAMITPAGAPFSMALEVLAYFYGDARTLNYTAYTYGRGFAAAHRRFAQAFLALPAIKGTVVDQGDADLKVRTYPSDNGTYVGVAWKGYAGKKLTIKVPGAKAGATVTNLVTGQPVTATTAGNDLQFEVESGPMELNAYLVK